MRLLRRRVATTELDEATAYARCHETPGRDVRIVKLPPRRERYDVLADGERLRRSFEARLDARALEEIGPLHDSPAPAGASLAVRGPEEHGEAAPEAGFAGREAKPAGDANDEAGPPGPAPSPIAPSG